MKAKGSHQPKFSVHVCADDQSHYLIVPNAKEQRERKKSSESGRDGGDQRDLHRCKGKV